MNHKPQIESNSHLQIETFVRDAVQNQIARGDHDKTIKRAAGASRQNKKTKSNGGGDPFPVFLKPREVAAMLGVTEGKLAQDRRREKGIPFLRAERTIRYTLDDVKDWISAHRVGVE